MLYDGGIFRDVYLYSAPLVQISDYAVETDLDNEFKNADLKLSVDVKNLSTSELSIMLYLQIFLMQTVKVYLHKILTCRQYHQTVLLQRILAENNRSGAWSDENPYLYTLVISLYDKTSGKRV